MKSIRAGRNHRDITNIIRTGQPFHSQNFNGKRYQGFASVPGLGAMPRSYREDFYRDRDHHGIDYIVWSYETPIAWHRRDGVWVRPDHKYSVTTSIQQGRCPTTGTITELATEKLLQE